MRSWARSRNLTYASKFRRDRKIVRSSAVGVASHYNDERPGTHPSQHRLDCAGANIDARLSRRGSGVWFNRPDSKSGEPNGSGGSNPSLSATLTLDYFTLPIVPAK